MSRKRTVHIVGGGFSGLMTAFFLTKAGHQVTVSEGHRWGGLIATEKTPWGATETAASGFLLTDLLEKVSSDIQIPLAKPLPGARQRWIANEKPERFPVSYLQAVGGGLRYFVHKASGLHRPRAFELLSAWGNRVVGRAISEQVILPAVQGIYGLDSRHLSASLILNPLFQKNRAKRKGSVAPALGMGQWIDGLVNALRESGVQLREESLNQIPDADHVILAGSANAKAKILKQDFLKAADLLAQIKTHPLISVSTFWEKSEGDFPGFGVLFHPDKGWSAAGVLQENQIFEGRSEHRSERWIFANPELMAKSDSQLLEIIQKQRDRLGWSQQFLGMRVNRWPTALPAYSLDLEKTLKQDFELPAHIHLLGNDMGEIGLTSLAERAHKLSQKIGETYDS